MADIISVTEGRVSVTANDTEENIRAGAGFASADAGAGATPGTPEPVGDDKAAESAGADRNPDGTFKAKALDPEVAKPVETGDPRKSHQAKINAAIAKQREAERRADDAERRANEREAELLTYKQPKAPVTGPAPAALSPADAERARYVALVKRYEDDPAAPKVSDFEEAGFEDPYGAHKVAMNVFIGHREAAEREARDAQTRAQRERTDHANTTFEILEQRHPGFHQAVKDDPTVYPPFVLELIAAEAAQDPHLSAELLFHLTTHPEDAARLVGVSSPIAAAREIGRLTASLSSASSGPETPLPVTTTAKPLIKPVRPSVMAHESSPPDDLPFGPQYIARMNEQDRKLREARRA